MQLYGNKQQTNFANLASAAWELDNFAKILEAEGVKVRRPEVGPKDFDQGYETPDFKVRLVTIDQIHD